MDDYEDIINLPHHVSKKHPQMPLLNRAVQFSPFAALTGYEDAISETGRLTDSIHELTDDEKAELNAKLNTLIDLGGVRAEASVTFFKPDERKDGGRYVTVTGTVRRVDECARSIIFTDGTTISIDAVMEIVLL